MKMCSRCSLRQLCSSQWIDSNIKCTIFGGEKCFLKEAYQTQATKRKQVPFSCETLITTKWKELDVFASLTRALPQQGSGFETHSLSLGLEPEQVWTLSSHTPGGRLNCAVRLCAGQGCLPPSCWRQRCNQPWDQRRGRKGRIYP